MVEIWQYPEDTRTWLQCSCGAVGHHVCVVTINQEEDLILQYHLEQDSFWWRIKTAVRYILNLEPSYHDILLNHEEQLKLIAIMSKVKLTVWN